MFQSPIRRGVGVEYAYGFVVPGGQLSPCCGRGPEDQFNSTSPWAAGAKTEVRAGLFAGRKDSPFTQTKAMVTVQQK
ncbi:hypothetical protein [Nocardia sp. NPDC052316]|uniref:hypothetical protein n=1 Tax=Nocardia sp. NPDC052316 TaxID=3364329 RepID=UPI0037C7709A